MPHQIPLAKNTTTGVYESLKIDASGKLQVSDSQVNLNTDNLEARLPSALTGSGNLKVCIQELGNEGSERLNTDAIVDGMRGGLPTALTGDGNLKVSIQEDHTHNLALASNQTSMISELTSIKTAVELLDNAVSGNELQVDIVASALPSGSATSGNQTTMISRLDDIKTAVEIIDNVVSGSEIQADIVSSALPSGASTSANQTSMITELTSIKTAVEILDNVVSGSEIQADIVSSALPSGASTSANQTSMITELTSIKTAVEILDNVVSGSEIQADIISSALPSGASTSALQSNIDSKLGDIKTAVEILDNAVSGNELQVDIVSSALPSGGATSALQGDHNTKLDHLSDNLDTIDGVLDDILVKNGEIETTCNAILAKNTEIDIAVDAMSAKLPASLGQKANASSLSTCRSTTAGAYDLSGRTTIGTASTSTKLLCDSDGHLQVDVLSGASGDPSAVSSLFSTETNSTANGSALDTGEITITSGKQIGVIVDCGSTNPSNGAKVFIGYSAGNVDYPLIGSSGSSVNIQIGQVDGAGNYVGSGQFTASYPLMKLTLQNGSGGTLTDAIIKVFQ